MSRLSSIEEEMEQNIYTEEMEDQEEKMEDHDEKMEDQDEKIQKKKVVQVAITFNILVWDDPKPTTLTGKINSFHYEEESGEMDLQIEKIVLKWFEFLLDDDKHKGLCKLTPDNSCIGILAVSEIYSTCGLFKCDTSYRETRAFDFYYDSFLGNGYFKGERIVIHWDKLFKRADDRIRKELEKN